MTTETKQTNFLNTARFAALAEAYNEPVPASTLRGRRLNTFCHLVEGGYVRVIASQNGPAYAPTDLGKAKYELVATSSKRPGYARGLPLAIKVPPAPATTNPVQANPDWVTKINAMSDRMAALEAENARLRAAAKPVNGIGFKVSAKGAISVIGLQRFPVTLYWNQWTRLIEHLDQLQAFAEQNRSVLVTK
jgi:hypothetical protein